MDRRRGIISAQGGAQPAPVIPDEYQRVAYIGIPNKSFTGVETHIRAQEIKKVILEADVSTTVDETVSVFFLTTSNSYKLGWFSNYAYLKGFTCSPSVAKNASANGTFTFTIDGNQSAQTNPIYLFGGTSSMGNSVRSRNLHCSHAWMEDASGNTIYDAVPVYRKSDNKIGLWDFVSQQFEPSHGSPTKGADV